MKYIYEKIILYSSINLIYVSSICMIHINHIKHIKHIKNINNNKDVVSSE